MTEPEIVIIGAGFSGITAASHIIRNADFPMKITIIEAEKDQFAGGVAYSRGTASANHETNISARSMGLGSSSRVTSRHNVQKYLQAEYAAARDINGQFPEKQRVRERVLTGRATDIVEHSGGVKVTYDHTHGLYEGSNYAYADRVIVATGNHEVRRLSCVTPEKLQDPQFASCYVDNQWLDHEKQDFSDLYHSDPVLIIGTALSGYDAARTLIEQGHKGKITMMSRNGYEHFQYPQDHDWPDIELPKPQFMLLLTAEGPESERWKEVAQQEFRQLTGINVDLKTGVVKHDGGLVRAWKRQQSFSSEQVLKAWEKYTPDLMTGLRLNVYGDLLSQYSSLINSLRVGAGFEVSEVIKAAKKRGQLKVVAASIDDMEYARHSAVSKRMDVTYTLKGSGKKVTNEFGLVVSSLGANQNYYRTQDRLWRNLIDREYAHPHDIGVGIRMKHYFMDAGLMTGANRIYAVGTPMAGEIMHRRGLVGPPAFSMPVLKPHITQVSQNVLNAARADGVRRYAAKPAQPKRRGFPRLGF